MHCISRHSKTKKLSRKQIIDSSTYRVYAILGNIVAHGVEVVV